MNLNFDISILFIGKIIMLFALFLYIIFASIVVRQVYLMTATLRTGFEFPVKSLAWAHLFVALGVFIFSLVIL